MDGYVRVSQVAGRSGDRFQSPAEQRDTINAWAKAHGVKIAMIHEDLDRSGGTMIRPGMDAALERIARGKSSGIVVARIDRFARTVVGGLLTIQTLDEQGARVVSVAESIDPATPVGRAMLGLLLIMAEWQRDLAEEALTASQARAVAAGRYPGKTPYGYRRDDGRVVIDPDTSKVVRRVFELRAAGMGWRAIADTLTREKVPTSLGRSAWAPTTVSGIIQSRAALGVWRGPRGGYLEDAWPAIVTPDLWEAANAVKGTTDSSRQHHDRLLAGIARCAACRSTLKRSVNPHGFVSYGCTTIGCANKGMTVGAAVLDEYVTALVDERLAGIATESAPSEDLELGALVAAREAAAREFELWRDDTEMREILGDVDYRAGLKERARVRDAADLALAAHHAQHRSGILVPLTGERAVQRLADLDWEDRRRVVQAYLHSVWVRRSKVRGLAARRHVGRRARVVWMDDRHQPDLPDRQREFGPVEWPDEPPT